MPEPQAIAFDFDDTLLDWPATLRRTLGKMAPPEVADRYLDLAPTTWRSEGDVVIHRNTWKLGEEPEHHWSLLGRPDLAAPFRAALELAPMAGALEVVRHLRRQVPVAICTNNMFIERELSALGWVDEFDHVVVALDPPKPHPDAFATLCSVVNIEPEHVLFVGDSVHSDVRGAHAAGLQAVWLDRYGDAWSPPPGVHRISELHQVAELAGWAP